MGIKAFEKKNGVHDTKGKDTNREKRGRWATRKNNLEPDTYR